MTADLLDPSALLSKLPNLLPPAEKKLKSPHDGIVALLHTAMVAVGFRLVAVDEDAPARSILDNVLPDEWNKHGPGNYAFRYKHEQSSLEYLVKIVKLGPRTLINAIAIESDKAASLDIQTSDFVSQSFYPHDLTASDAQPLVHGFISSNRVSDLMSQYKLKIIQKLMPGLNKPGYTEDATADASTTVGGSAPRASNSNPAPARPRPEAPPNEPTRSPYSHIPPENPLSIGRRDLDPFPQNPFAPPPLFPPNSGDGMYVGPDHPIFGGRRGGFGSAGQPQGPWGGDGFLPPLGAPPGARFDPVGPALPGRGRGGVGGIGGIGGMPGGGNMRGPDNDEFMPPGAGDMFM
ncbi:hypothetical protein GLOTRDRAFT_70655 [Gloeophyllum trabeum ATCC 11539]|uniref:Uncharacterized protein n=1 Tax=Gloeophyllum trabeum (strain ATCC 11539 / FP-39264 / Madison 617) TaxID=670483 RepID=S7QIY8_GLOTA|nr:uncharacterized protein GLOTRDRAFT_70655 [Gloeophyllum trabeum ATCC 11539]EPQ59327.1 hypothetical protein GLOTRDRAFT_70655 [Gloeophyllum trabeum ATCC 11539]